MSTSVKSEKAVLTSMLDAGCHFGHRSEKWNPKMRPFIYTKREGIHIFDLTKTYQVLMKACEILKDAAAKGKTILLVSTKLQAARLIDEAAIKLGCPYVTKKWIPGLLTNFDTVKKRIKYFRDLKEQQSTGELDKYTKKERLDLSRQLKKLQEAFGGVENVTKLPDFVVLLDAFRDQLVLREARKLKIPTIAICDTNSDPDLVTYPIPGNDDAVKSLRFFMDQFAAAIEEGKKEVAVKE